MAGRSTWKIELEITAPVPGADVFEVIAAAGQHLVQHHEFFITGMVRTAQDPAGNRISVLIKKLK